MLLMDWLSCLRARRADCAGHAANEALTRDVDHVRLSAEPSFDVLCVGVSGAFRPICDASLFAGSRRTARVQSVELPLEVYIDGMGHCLRERRGRSVSRAETTTHASGSGLGTLAQVIESHPAAFVDFKLRASSSVAKANEVLGLVRSYLITHAHLDHTAGMVLSAGTFAERKRVIATPRTLDTIMGIFAGGVWPELATQDESANGFSAYLCQPCVVVCSSLLSSQARGRRKGNSTAMSWVDSSCTAGLARLHPSLRRVRLDGVLHQR